MLLFSDEDRIEAICQANIARPVVVTPSRPPHAGKSKKTGGYAKTLRACKNIQDSEFGHVYTHARRFFGSPTFFLFTGSAALIPDARTRKKRPVSLALHFLEKQGWCTALLFFCCFSLFPFVSLIVYRKPFSLYRITGIR